MINLNGAYKYLADADEQYTINDLQAKYEAGFEFQCAILPAHWELHGLHNHNGAVWYIKEFEGPNTINDLKILDFKGCDYFTNVWLNWEEVGFHEGYFQTFIFDVTRQIKIDEKNILIVKVSSPREEPGTVWPHKKKLIKGVLNHHDCRPGGWSNEFGQDRNTGGIWNDVSLYNGIKVFVKNIKVTPVVNWSDNSVEVNIELDCITNDTSEVTRELNFEIIDPLGKKNLTTKQVSFTHGVNKSDHSILIKSLHLWWTWDLGKQNLYTLTISGEYMPHKKIHFGIREFKLDEDQQFLINKKRLFLRGTNIIPDQLLGNLDEEKIKSIVRFIKEANINIVRVHAHVNRGELYDALDNAGILVWQDFPLQWTYDESEDFKNNALVQIKNMAEQLYNHPSIAFWCCHNEPGEQITSLDPHLKTAIEEIDQTRIIRLASNYEEHPYDGWYWGKKEYFATAPMGPLVTEFGAQAVPDIDSLKKFLSDDEIEKPDWAKWEYHNFQYDQTFNVAKISEGSSIQEFIENSQNYQSELIKTAIDFYRRKRFEGITGIFQFMFVDSWPSITWSVVDYFRKKKKGFYQLKESFQPLYISVRLRQDIFLPGKDLQHDIWIINDLHKSFSGLKLEIKLDGKLLGTIENVELKEDSQKLYNYESLKYRIPEDCNRGKYFVEYLLFEIDELISYNKYEIEIVKQINPWSEKWKKN